MRRCALDYHKSSNKKCSGQWEQAFLGEIKSLIESTVSGETDDWVQYWVDVNYHCSENEENKGKIICLKFSFMSISFQANEGDCSS